MEGTTKAANVSAARRRVNDRAEVLEVTADLCSQVERRLKCHIQSVPEARRAVARALDDVGLRRNEPGSGTRDDALLIASEMLANAVRACRDVLTVRVDVHRTWLKIAVSDDSPDPAVRQSPGPEDAHGRGVDIIATLSDEWGQTPWDGSTKTVWSRLNLGPEVALSISCDEAVGGLA